MRYLLWLFFGIVATVMIGSLIQTEKKTFALWRWAPDQTHCVKATWETPGLGSACAIYEQD
jgi:hypothetical protein